MNKKKALEVIIESAILYKKNLLGKKIMFIYQDETNIGYYKAKFEKNNFLHLTGLKTNLSSNQFFDRVMDKKINHNDFAENEKGTARLKLDVLRELMNLTSISKITGDYNSSKVYLHTEKIAGNIRACMGFVRGKNKDGNYEEYYYPNTCLKEDSRNVIQDTKRILLILDAISEKVLYAAKEINIEEIMKRIK